MNHFRIRIRRLLFATGAAMLVFSLSISSISSYAQNAQEIVAKYIEALGGKEKLQSINSMFIEGVAVMDDGTAIDAKVWKVYDRLFRQEVSIGTSSNITIITPGRGWVSNPQTNGLFKALPYDRLKALQPQIDPAGPLMDYSAKGCQVNFEGRDTIRDIPCYRIKLFCPMGQSVTYYIDAKTYYLVRETGKGAMMCAVLENKTNPGGDICIDFSDYKKTPEGYIFPYTIVTNAFGAKMNIERVEINHNIDVEAMSRPKKEAAPQAKAKRSNSNAATGI